jgi:hypothetical protein
MDMNSQSSQTTGHALWVAGHAIMAAGGGGFLAWGPLNGRLATGPPNAWHNPCVERQQRVPGSWQCWAETCVVTQCTPSYLNMQLSSGAYLRLSLSP